MYHKQDTALKLAILTFRSHGMTLQLLMNNPNHNVIRLDVSILLAMSLTIGAPIF